MEQLEVPSGSYLIRWVECAIGNTIHWSVKPHKKSLNFGLFRHPGQNSNRPSTAQSTDSTTSTIKDIKTRPTLSTQKSDDARERLSAAGLIAVLWHGRCDPDKVTTGTWQVTGQGGMFALVFDNTFSRQISKTATFVLMTYPSDAPPPATHALHHADSSPGLKSPDSSNKASPSADAMSVRSGDPGQQPRGEETAGFRTGVLKKRKRKRHQGYARRFFSLDFTSSTLSYYLNRDSSALRGAIPLSLAVISANKSEREICIDSGAEIWHLRALNDRDWEAWTAALQKAAQNANKPSTVKITMSPAQDQRPAAAAHLQQQHGLMEERSWAGVEGLVGRISGIRDAVRRLAITAEQHAAMRNMGSEEASSSQTSVISADSNDHKRSRKVFWKRKSPGQNLHPQDVRKSVAASVLASTSVVGTPPIQSQQQDFAPHLHALLRDLDSVVSDFSTLVSENKQRRLLHRASTQYGAPALQVNPSRMSMESQTSDEFFDAEDALDGDHVVMLNDDEGDRSDRDADTSSVADNEASDDSDSGEEEEDVRTYKGELTKPPTTPGGTTVQDLTPLPLSPIARRATIPPPKVMPPSLIGFLRKNVGKDLSTIAMPVSANEPTSLLQRSAEQLEYSQLLDAASSTADTGEQLLLLAAFAISGFSNTRAKERSIRKPFNPLLGETYELVREDRQFRFLAEKICHRPVVMAIHASSPNWQFCQSPQPTQKFWGKSAELNTYGRVRISFNNSGDMFSYAPATSFLRNIIAGEKYAEPTGAMHIHHENSGAKATISFKAAKGMFAGRSEEVDVVAYRSDGTPYDLTLSGKWCESLTRSDGVEIWRVNGETMGYGFTEFAAQLNEITPIEKGRVAPTDSRCRPDQRMLERGELDDAEETKVRLEEKQRVRRREMEEAGESWKPRWFEKVKEYADEEVWRIKEGEEGYWDVRRREDEARWTGRCPELGFMD
ncbi:hypothetical protein EX30DRAFT_353664 [Ascodesmis nigricans]|uniref:PH domain-containing protein n=1 Tax=Ascodesmis nigricans TaxID=341454 RepID=A0A4S2N382_9PEZI|nr:hypothetical protein EX30DRAFT_353664 [Ascodesmis nigricans]